MAGIGLVCLVGCTPLTVQVHSDDEMDKPWAEAAAPLPDPPKPENLIEFYVAANTTNRFFIDRASLTVGPDDAVRYTVVIRSAAGASTVNVEGIRCDARERKLYAFGRPDSTWSPAKSPAWTRITNAGAGGYRYVLLREYFCPGGISIRDAAEGIDALKRGGHPANQVR